MRLGDVRSASLPSSRGSEDDGARHDTDDSKKVIYDVVSRCSLYQLLQGLCLGPCLELLEKICTFYAV